MTSARTPEDIKSTVFQVLRDIAPEADPSTIKPDVGLRDQLDIDSMDFLNFIIGLHKALKVDIPEADYPKLATIDGCVQYLTNASPHTAKNPGP